MAQEIEELGFRGDVPVLDYGIIATGEEMELVEARVPNEVDGAGVAAKAAEGSTGLGIEDVDGAGKVTSS